MRTKVEVEYRYAANGQISVVARVPSVRHSAHVKIERSETPNTDDLRTWRARLLGQPENEAAAFAKEAQSPTVDLSDRESIRKRLDALLTKVGQAALRCRVPDSLAPSQQAAQRAAAEVDQTRAKSGEAKRAMDASLHDPAMFQQGAVLSQAEQAVQQACTRAGFTCLVLGRECVQSGFGPPGTEEELEEVAKLRDRLDRAFLNLRRLPPQKAGSPFASSPRSPPSLKFARLKRPNHCHPIDGTKQLIFGSDRRLCWSSRIDRPRAQNIRR